jgi:hypothetical protein
MPGVSLDQAQILADSVEQATLSMPVLRRETQLIVTETHHPVEASTIGSQGQERPDYPHQDGRSQRSEGKPVDINAIADQVYQTLMHRQQFEAERRGLY